MVFQVVAHAQHGRAVAEYHQGGQDGAEIIGRVRGRCRVLGQQEAPKTKMLTPKGEHFVIPLFYQG
jgi:hypothetical protein